MFRTVFTEDCQLDYGEIGAWNGVDAVSEFMQRAHAMAGHTLHRLTNQVIDVDGDSAVARTYVDALIMTADNKSGVNGIGYYDNELVHTCSPKHCGLSCMTRVLTCWASSSARPTPRHCVDSSTAEDGSAPKTRRRRMLPLSTRSLADRQLRRRFRKEASRG